MMSRSIHHRVDNPAFGLDGLLELFDNDHAAILRLLGAAIASIHRDVDAIAGASGIHDRRAVIEAAHRLKGTSGSIGASRLIAIGSHIEETAARTDAAIAPATLLELREAVALVDANITGYAATWA